MIQLFVTICNLKIGTYISDRRIGYPQKELGAFAKEGQTGVLFLRLEDVVKVRQRQPGPKANLAAVKLPNKEAKM